MRIFTNITCVFNAAHYAVTHLTSIMPAMNECDLTRGLLMYKGLNVDVGSFQVSFGFPCSRTTYSDRHASKRLAISKADDRTLHCFIKI